IPRPCFRFLFNATATPPIYTLSLHDALPISTAPAAPASSSARGRTGDGASSKSPTLATGAPAPGGPTARIWRGTAPSGPASEGRSEEHTSELQSRSDLVCRLLLEKKKTHNTA